ncbi:cobyrinate a,c-diamide synthase [Methanoplanus endosymbiosus]|uniref:Cobyrinate a,c-diamide synthase n=1 Tax=Methanoplanus endosymbiosus TaxID=33865 RepID=A0A9E7PMA8_9EURY|nr:cobyrinate a,c-diamide synthase [Methanoplanus endosymbiosus]UUX92825.1 hydrogenobyrinic acid a,c-diamide synthase (glutamine-hydrolyzing) [Methanoplanus endosymbiosus]
MTPTIIIAGTHSGCGKTTISSAIMSALKKRGLRVQPFKVGPDFIDPTHHTDICGRVSRNLDPFMMGEDGVLRTFADASKDADISVIEGVMGLYDGLEGTDAGSTAHVAKILNAPVILIVDVKGSSRSANASVLGFTEFDRNVRVEGVIFNRIGSERHRAMISASLKREAVGWIPWEREKSLNSRHLGLKMAHETPPEESPAAFTQIIEDNTDLKRIIEIAGTGEEIPVPLRNSENSISTNTDKKARIGVAYDSAFNFYYQDNFDRLEKYGADIIYFSPMKDEMPAVDALYFGGGYPEIYMEKLEKSKCRTLIKKCADDDMPIYAECGGLIYLSRSIDYEGRKSDMCGILPADAVKMNRFQALGYVEATCRAEDSPLPSGISVKGHEFHYTKLNCDSDTKFAMELTRGKGIEDGRDGIYSGNTIGGYTHVYFTDRFAEAFVNNAVKYSER